MSMRSDDSLAAGGRRIRPIDPDSPAEIQLVAARMRRTLIEVLGEERGTALYDMAWLEARVRWHLDPTQSTARIFLAEDADGRITGHTIVRLDHEDDGRPIGLFSTTYVDPDHRRSAIASHLLQEGEAWLIAQGMTRAVTDTSRTNTKLIGLYEKHGYQIVLTVDEMVRLAKELTTAEPGGTG